LRAPFGHDTVRIRTVPGLGRARTLAYETPVADMAEPGASSVGSGLASSGGGRIAACTLLVALYWLQSGTDISLRQAGRRDVGRSLSATSSVPALRHDLPSHRGAAVHGFAAHWCTGRSHAGTAKGRRADATAGAHPKRRRSASVASLSILAGVPAVELPHTLAAGRLAGQSRAACTALVGTPGRSGGTSCARHALL